MGLRCVNDLFLYCTNPSHLDAAKRSTSIGDGIGHAPPCRLKPGTCGFTETLSQQVAKLPPPPPKPPKPQKAKPTPTEAKP